MTFWGGSVSGSSDPCFWLMDPDPDIFVIDLQVFLLITVYFLKVHYYIYIIFQRKKSKRSHKVIKVFLLFLIGDRRIRIRSRSGSIRLTNGSGCGSRRPKTIRGPGSATLLKVLRFETLSWPISLAELEEVVKNVYLYTVLKHLRHIQTSETTKGRLSCNILEHTGCYHTYRSAKMLGVGEG
jgi:hypothetical protein